MNILSHSRQRVAPTVAAALCAIGLLAQAFLPQPAWAADPVQVSRYDDADAYLPTAERKNRDGVRLFLRQQEGEQLFKVMTPRNVSVDVVARIPEGADIGVVLLLGGTSVLSIVNDRLDRSFSFQPRSRDYWWANNMATFLVDAPSDRLGKDGIQDLWWRSGPEHAADLQAVLDAIGQRFPGPLVIQGHSNGAVSLANVASLKAPQVKAYVFSGPAHYKAGTPRTPAARPTVARPRVFCSRSSPTPARSSGWKGAARRSAGTAGRSPRTASSASRSRPSTGWRPRSASSCTDLRSRSCRAQAWAATGTSATCGKSTGTANAMFT
jgi:hypothetical protein